MQVVHLGFKGQGLGTHITQANSFVKGEFFDAQIIFSGDLLRGDQVKAGLGFTRIRDGGGTHFKVSFGSSELFGHGRLLGFDKIQAFLRCQNIKVRLAQTNNEFLFGQFELNLRHGLLFETLFQSDLIGWSVKGLAGVECQAARPKFPAASSIGLVAQGGFRKITTQTRRGAQQGPGLVSLGLCRFVLRLGRLEGGIVAFCRFVERGQALGLGGACKGGHHGQCQGQGAQFHGGSF